MLFFIANCDAVFSKDMSVINKGKVLDAVHSLEAQRLLVAQGVYCIRPKCKAKAEKESPKFKFSSQCPDFLEKKTERKIELLWGPIAYQKLNKTKKRYWHRDFQKETPSMQCKGDSFVAVKRFIPTHFGRLIKSDG